MKLEEKQNYIILGGPSRTLFGVPGRLLDSARIELIISSITIHRKDSSARAVCYTVRFIKHKTYLANVKDHPSE